MASIREVAQEAGVGVGTVSRALNGSGYVSPETRKKIEKAAKKLKYTPNELARNLYHNKTGIVGVIVPDLEHPFFSALVKHIEMELYEQGYKTMICNTVGISRREQEYLDMLERNMVDGIITASHGLEVEEYRKQAKPIVSIDRDLGAQIPLIGCDHAKGGKLAAELMLKAHRKKVFLVSGISPKVMANDRYVTFMKILEENGVTVLQEVMEWNIFSWDAHYHMAEEIFRLHPDIDGIFGGDLAALACLNVAQRRGIRIPEDISIVGFDAMTPSNIVYPRLTAIRQNVELLAEISVNTLLDMVEQRKNVPHRLILDVEIQCGGTA
ncbi:MAG: LacI family transcriptional regulator [Dorea sp.]|nr:LacI family transcriptional regulator [Dorea sp.]